jgi:hypothetical protein
VREIAEWVLRNCITPADREFLKAVGIAWSPESPIIATPPGHALVRGSNGVLHHIPVANVGLVGSVDSDALVLHIEPDPTENR